VSWRRLALKSGTRLTERRSIGNASRLGKYKGSLQIISVSANLYMRPTGWFLLAERT